MMQTDNLDKIKQIREVIARRLEYCNLAYVARETGLNTLTIRALRDQFNDPNYNPTTETLVKVCNLLEIEL